MHRLNTLVAAALVAAGSLPIAPAQTFETVYSLPDPGGQPFGALVKTDAGSFLYQKGVQRGECTFFGETSTGKISIVSVP
jgi:hypothetical protein